jgi:hypothetical protein
VSHHNKNEKADESAADETDKKLQAKIDRQVEGEAKDEARGRGAASPVQREREAAAADMDQVEMEANPPVGGGSVELRHRFFDDGNDALIPMPAFAGRIVSIEFEPSGDVDERGRTYAAMINGEAVGEGRASGGETVSIGGGAAFGPGHTLIVRGSGLGDATGGELVITVERA